MSLLTIGSIQQGQWLFTTVSMPIALMGYRVTCVARRSERSA
jgi:hypothetical protein